MFIDYKTDQPFCIDAPVSMVSKDLRTTEVTILLYNGDILFPYRCQSNGWPWNAYNTEYSPTRVMYGALVSHFNHIGKHLQHVTNAS